MTVVVVVIVVALVVVVVVVLILETFDDIVFRFEDAFYFCYFIRLNLCNLLL